MPAGRATQRAGYRTMVPAGGRAGRPRASPAVRAVGLSSRAPIGILQRSQRVLRHGRYGAPPSLRWSLSLRASGSLSEPRVLSHYACTLATGFRIDGRRTMLGKRHRQQSRYWRAAPARDTGGNLACAERVSGKRMTPGRLCACLQVSNESWATCRAASLPSRSQL